VFALNGSLHTAGGAVATAGKRAPPVHPLPPPVCVFVCVCVCVPAPVGQAVTANAAVARTMDSTERTLRFAIMLLTLHYFRAMSSLQMQKSIWGTSALAGRGAGPIAGVSLSGRTKQRAVLDEAAALRAARLNAIAQAEAKASAGFVKRMHASKTLTQSARLQLARSVKKRKRQEEAARRLQSFWRGYLDRRLTVKWMLLRREVAARQAIVQVRL
jgi:hypothetical protein